MSFAARSYQGIAEIELTEQIIGCFKAHNGLLGIKSVTKKLITILCLDTTQLGPRCGEHKNAFTAMVAKVIEGLCKKGVLLQQTGGQWVLNERYTCLQADYSKPIEIDINELTALGKVQRLIIWEFKQNPGTYAIDRQELIGRVTAVLPPNISVGTIDHALTSLGKSGEGYLEIPIRGAVALTNKGEDAIKTGILHFRTKPNVRHGQIRKAFPDSEVLIMILYVLAEAKTLSIGARDIAIRCAEIYTIEPSQAIGPHAHDKKPFEEHCYRIIRELKKDGYIVTRVGGNDAWHITELGWSKLKSSEFDLHNLGLDIPKDQPMALVKSLQPVLPPRLISNGNGKHKEEIAKLERVPTQEVKGAEEITYKSGSVIPINSKIASKEDVKSEFEAMGLIWQTLEPFDVETQNRILSWVNRRRKQNL